MFASSDGEPIPHLLEQAKALLVAYQTSMPQVSSLQDKKEAEEKAAAEAATQAALAKKNAAVAQAAAEAAAAAAAEAAGSAVDPDEDEEMRELRLMVESQMKK